MDGVMERISRGEKVMREEEEKLERTGEKVR